MLMIYFAIYSMSVLGLGLGLVIDVDDIQRSVLHYLFSKIMSDKYADPAVDRHEYEDMKMGSDSINKMDSNLY